MDSPLLSNLTLRGDKQLHEKRERAKEMRNGEGKLNDVLRKSIPNLVKVWFVLLLAPFI